MESAEPWELQATLDAIKAEANNPSKVLLHPKPELEGQPPAKKAKMEDTVPLVNGNVDNKENVDANNTVKEEDKKETITIPSITLNNNNNKSLLVGASPDFKPKVSYFS